MFIRSTYHHKKILIIGVLVMVGTMGGTLTFAATSNTLNQLQFQANSSAYSITTGTTGDLNISTQASTGGGIGIGTRQQGNALYIDTSNNVGIGTTSPGYKLNITGTLPGQALRLTMNGETDVQYIDSADSQSWEAGTNSNGWYIYDDNGGSYALVAQKATGYIGIKTTNPGSTLDVNGTFQIDTQASCSGTGQALKTDTSGRVTCGTVAGGVTPDASQGGSGIGTYVPYWTGATTLSASSSLYVSGGTSGNVGIGTTAPGQKLDVNGIGKFGAYALIGTNISAGYYQDATNGAYRAIVPNTTTNGYYFQTNGGGLTTMYVGLGGTYNGNVGIGTTAPAAPLSVVGNGNFTGTVTAAGFSGPLTGTESAANVSSGSFGANTGGGPYTFPANLTLNGNTLQIGTTGCQYLYLANASNGITYCSNQLTFNTSQPQGFNFNGGNVGIGTTGPTTLLQVGNGGGTGKISINSQDNSYGQFQIGNPASGGEASMSFISGVTAFGGSPASVNGTSYIWDIGANNYAIGGNKFSIGNQAYGGSILTLQSNGNVGIGTTSPGYKLDVQGGTINASGGVYDSGSRVYSANNLPPTTNANSLSSLGNALNAEATREVKNSNGTYVYSTYSGGTGGASTYNQVLTWGNGSSEIQISGDWINTNSTPLYVRSLRDCCQNWTGWTQILTSGTHPYAANMNQGVATTNSPTFANANITGTVTAAGFSGPLTGTESAGNVSSGTFGGNTGGGGYTFPATLVVNGATTLNSTLSVAGATTLNSSLGVSGATTLSGGLGVTGNGSFSGTVTAGEFYGPGTGLTGTAASLTSGGLVNFVNQSGGRYTTDYNTLLQTGFYNGESTPPNAPNPYGQVIVAKGIDTGLQIAGGYNSDNLYFRGWWSSGSGFSSWRTVLHNGNFNSYAPTLTGGGASGTWGINISGTASNANALTPTNSYTMAGLTVNGNGNFTGTVTATGGFSGPLTGTENATNVSAGNFGDNTGNGYYGIGWKQNGVISGPLDVSKNGGNNYSDGVVIGQVDGDNTNTIQSYIDTGAGGGYGNWSYASGCCNTLYINNHGGDVSIGNGSRGITLSGNVYFPGSGVWNTSGNVGIGTTPGYKLDVSGDIHATGWLRTDGSNGWYSQSYGGGWFMQDTSWVRTYNSKSVWTDTGLLGSNGGLTIGYSGAGSPSGGAIISGNVGIGTTGPSAKLDIAGSYYSEMVSAINHSKTTDDNCTGSVTIDWSYGNTQHCTVTGATTFTFSNGQTGGNYRLLLKWGGSYTITWPASVRWPSGTAPTLTYTTGKTDYVGFMYNGFDSTYDGNSFNANF